VPAFGADFSTDDDRCRYRQVVVGLLQPGFEGRDADGIERQLTGTSVLFWRYGSVAGLVSDGREELTARPLMAEVDQPGIGAFSTTARRWSSPEAVRGRPGDRAVLGEHTADVRSEILGLSARS
jgi:2-methylfumaryl-CoA isomerase